MGETMMTREQSGSTPQPKRRLLSDPDVRAVSGERR